MKNFIHLAQQFLALQPEGFLFSDHVIGGDECVFIRAEDIKTKWTADNLVFRSIILRKSDCKVINSSWKKFFNYFEQPDLEPFPKENFTAVEKMDGSTLILGSHNGELIHRTRGTVDARKLNNGHEIEFLKQKYPLLFEFLLDRPTLSLITEWETPTNYIVLRRVKEPTLVLTGVIENDSLKYWSQDLLDILGEMVGLERPVTHEFSSIEECMEEVRMWRGLEGIVAYSENGQYLRKIKAEEYLALHKIYTGFKTAKNVLEVFMAGPRQDNFEEFFKYFEKVVDFEIAIQFEKEIRQIAEGYKTYLEKVEIIKQLLFKIKGFTRKEQAMDIIAHYTDWRKGVAFLLLDKKEIPDKVIEEAVRIESKI